MPRSLRYFTSKVAAIQFRCITALAVALSRAETRLTFCKTSPHDHTFVFRCFALVAFCVCANLAQFLAFSSDWESHVELENLLLFLSWWLLLFLDFDVFFLLLLVAIGLCFNYDSAFCFNPHLLRTRMLNSLHHATASFHDFNTFSHLHIKIRITSYND